MLPPSTNMYLRKKPLLVPLKGKKSARKKLVSAFIPLKLDESIEKST